jgi:hypothetical protein
MLDDLIYKLSTSYDADGKIMQELATQTKLSDLCQNMVRWTLDTREAEVKKALIALGWTPPGDTRRLSPGNVTEILRAACRDAYWYGEDIGDSAMAFAHEEEWFKQALEELDKLYNQKG